MYPLLVNFNARTHFSVHYNTAQYSTVQYSAVNYSAVQYSAVQYSTVKHRTYLSFTAWQQPLVFSNSTPVDLNLLKSPFLRLLEDTARYAGLLLALTEGLLCCFGPFFAIFGVQ